MIEEEFELVESFEKKVELVRGKDGRYRVFENDECVWVQPYDIPEEQREQNALDAYDYVVYRGDD